MKTYLKALYVFLIVLALNFSLSLSVYSKLPIPDNITSIQHLNQDTAYLNFSGIIIDIVSKKPVVFASIIVTGTNIGTVSNTDGEFLLKVPAFLKEGGIQIIILGYKTYSIPFSQLVEEGNEIFLEPLAYPIEEVEIRKIDPVNVLRDALKNIPVNYGTDPNMLTAFYRETIKQNRNYVAVSEAVFEVYKSGYGKIFDNDRIKIFKARKSQDVTRMDTVLFKLQGGPYYIFQMDIVRHPGDIFSGEVFDYYNYVMLGTATIQDRNTYMIAFDQKKEVPFPLYRGNIFVDIETKAIVSAEFSLSEIGIKKAHEFMIVKKPANMKVDVMTADYRVNYRLTEGKWVLSYARSEANFRVRWQRKLFRSNYYTVSEMAVTDINPRDVVKFKFRETTRPDDILTDNISYFSDPEFWGDYNIIRPEQTIEEAIEKVSRRLRKIEE